MFNWPRTRAVTQITVIATFLVCLVLMGGSASARAPASTTAATYAVTDLGTLGGSLCSGFSTEVSFATALNDAGDVVGTSCMFRGFQWTFHAFLYSGGVMRDIGDGVANGINSATHIVGTTAFSPMGIPGGSAFLYADGLISRPLPPGIFSQAFAINEHDQIVGLVSDQGRFDSWRAVLYSGGTNTYLGTLGGTFRSAALAVNDAGHTVGYSSISGDRFTHGFLNLGGGPIDLGTLGGAQSSAFGVNAADHVVGQAFTTETFFGSQTHAFLYRDGVMTDLGTLGGTFSSAYGINGGDVIVGASTTASSGQHAFLYRAGAMVDLNDLIPTDSGWVLTEARAINSSGQIAGNGLFGGQPRAFLLTPPTPPADSTAPVISALQSPGPNANGWNKTNVTVSWAVSDPESGIASSSGCAATTLTEDTSGTTLTCSAVNGAGLSSSALVTVKIDKTAPTMSFNGNAGTYTVDQTILITCTASDALSGIATTSCPAVASGPATNYVGSTATTSTTLTATATDVADNSAEASTTFTVTVTADGICRLTASLATADDICAKAMSIATAPTANAKAGKLDAFDRFSAAQTGKSIPADLAPLLRRLAHLL